MINFIPPKIDNPEWNSDKQITLRESGLSSPYPPPPLKENYRDQLPPGMGMFAIPPQLGTVGLINLALRSYYYAFDPALKKSRSDAIACRNDPILYQAAREVYIPISQLSWTLTAFDETNPKEVEAAKRVSEAFSLTPNLQQLFIQLLEALWYGRSGVAMIYEWSLYDPEMLVVKDWIPMQGDSLVPRWANQDWGMLVNSYFSGEMEAYNLGMVHYFTPSEMEAIVIHQGEREPADWFDSTSAGSIKGIGWRAKIFWYWFIKANIFAIMLDLVERVGSGIWLSYYDQSNPSGRADMENAIAAYKSKRVLSIPGDKEGKSAYNLKILEPGTTSHAIITDMMRYLDTAMRAVILGHPLGGDTSISVGGDPSAIYGDAISRTTKYHANNLAETISSRWIKTYYRYMCPGVRVGVFKFITDHPNADKVLQYAQVLAGLGFSIDLDELGLLCGVPKGQSGSTVASNVQSLSPVALQSPPQNVPVATNQVSQQPNNEVSNG